MKKFISIFLCLVLIATLAGPKQTVSAEITKIVIKASMEYTIIDGEKLYLAAPSNKSAKWSTSNKKVATVTQKGVVTGKKKGTAKITALVGKKKYTCKITVWDSNEIEDITFEGSGSALPDTVLTPDAEITFPSD